MNFKTFLVWTHLVLAALWAIFGTPDQMLLCLIVMWVMKSNIEANER